MERTQIQIDFNIIMLNDTKHNLNVLSNIDKNQLLKCKNNKIYLDNSWTGLLYRYDNNITLIIKTTLLNTLLYLELNIKRINTIQTEYIEKLSLLKKILESLNVLSNIKGYEPLKDLEVEIRNSLKDLETKLEEQKKESELSESESPESESESESEPLPNNNKSTIIQNVINFVRNSIDNIYRSINRLFSIFF